MEKHDAKRVAIIIEAIMESRLREALEGAGVTGFSVLPGAWRIGAVRQLEARRHCVARGRDGSGDLYHPARET